MLTEIAGYADAALAGAAYVPQISHMVRERCVAGISPPGFLVWFVASSLILVRAVATAEMVFVLFSAACKRRRRDSPVPMLRRIATATAQATRSSRLRDRREGTCGSRLMP